MTRGSILRGVLVLSLLTVSIAITACGGGGGGQSDKASSPTDQDLYLDSFLIVQETATGHLVQLGGPGSREVERDARLLFTFNVPVDLATVNDRTLRVGIPTPGGLYIEATGIYYHPVDPGTGEQILNQVLFNPTFSRAQSTPDNPLGFNSNEEYNIEIPSVLTRNVYVKNLHGDGVVIDYSAEFFTGSNYINTGDQPRWDSVNSLPKDGDVQVDAKADIVVAFDQAMKPDSFAIGDSFTITNLFDGSSPLGQLIFSADLTKAIFRPVFGYGKGVDSTGGNPNNPIDPQTDGYAFRVQVSRDVVNLAGNPIPQAVDFSFRTRYDPTQPGFDDIREEFESTANRDGTYIPGSANALWNNNSRPGFLAGVFTQGTVTISNHNNIVTLEPWAVGNTAAQWQALYFSSEVGGSPRTMTGFDWHKYATSQATTCQNVTIQIGHTKNGALTTNFANNYSATPTTCVNGVSYSMTIGTYTFFAAPKFTSNFSYNGSDNLILEINHTGSSGGGYTGTTPARGWAEWLVNNTGASTRAAQTVALGAPYGTNGLRTSVVAYDIRWYYLIDQSEARSVWYDTTLTTPQYLDVVLFPNLASQSAGTQSTFSFQGAPELPLSGGQPDVQKATNWEGALPSVSGYRFVRFEAVLVGNGTTGQQPSFDTLVIPYVFFNPN